MKITDILNNGKLSLSFEVFPPKTESNFDSVKLATEEIAALSPSFMSVTYGAGGGTSKYTLEIAKNIKEKYGVPDVKYNYVGPVIGAHAGPGVVALFYFGKKR